MYLESITTEHLNMKEISLHVIPISCHSAAVFGEGRPFTLNISPRQIEHTKFHTKCLG